MPIKNKFVFNNVLTALIQHLVRHVLVFRVKITQDY